ncbi:MAG: class I SAM-dependent methyltransferase [Deltaproteobacteria bacterium]|nr:class I SAM-dependent methyltransferase [Deltaproteobacteria bacterium]MBW2072191.1 class I SAM-dependent methyltransferase [Deltaproteobacteria bacterium]
MPKVKPFEKNVARYEEWFARYGLVYESELLAIKALLPQGGSGLEIGVGTGRFAAPLGIKVGIEPSEAMADVARRRGIEVIHGVAEALPFEDGRFEFMLMVTTICFLDDIEVSFIEAFRVLKPMGSIVVGFVDRNSPLGVIYEMHKDKNVFYREATFYTVEEVVFNLKNAGFHNFAFTQTIFRDLDKIKRIEPVEEGYGKGSFVVVKGMKADVAKS